VSAAKTKADTVSHALFGWLGSVVSFARAVFLSGRHGDSFLYTLFLVLFWFHVQSFTFHIFVVFVYVVVIED